MHGNWYLESKSNMHRYFVINCLIILLVIIILFLIILKNVDLNNAVLSFYDIPHQTLITIYLMGTKVDICFG